MYAWKCWRETRASFIFLLILSTAPALLVTLSPGLKEHNGWWHSTGVNTYTIRGRHRSW